MSDWLRGQDQESRLASFFKDSRRCRQDYEEAWGLGELAYRELLKVRK